MNRPHMPHHQSEPTESERVESLKAENKQLQIEVGRLRAENHELTVRLHTAERKAKP
jgi:predicted RNase H-like nuclease (RuvC/YqgF family)